MIFLRRFLAALFGITLVVFVIFGTVNPLGYFWGTHFLTTTPVTRARKETLFDGWNRKAPVQGLVFGSSQSMKLDPELLSRGTGLRYFNFAVSSGTLEDAYVLLDYAAERKAPLREILLGLDPWMFNRSELPHELADDWVLAPRVHDQRPTLLWKLGNAARLFAKSMTLSYAKEVVVSILATRSHWEPLHNFFDNGYMEYPDRDRRKAAGRYHLDRMISDCFDLVLNETPHPPALDSTQFAFLDRTLDRAHAMGVAVTIWMPPRHPRLYAMLDTIPGNRAWRTEVTDSIRRVAEAHGARFVNLSTIDRFGGDTLDWYDCLHYGARNADKAVNRLLESRPAGLPAPR